MTPPPPKPLTRPCPACEAANSLQNQVCISCGQPFKHIAGVPYVDLGGDGTDGGAGMPEDARIDLIGKTVMAMGPEQSTGFIVESGEGKAERYIKKLLEKFPRIRIISQTIAFKHSR